MKDFRFWKNYCAIHLSEDENSKSDAPALWKRLGYSKIALGAAAGMAGAGYLLNRHADKKRNRFLQIQKNREMVLHHYGKKGLEQYDRMLIANQSRSIPIPSMDGSG